MKPRSCRDDLFGPVAGEPDELCERLQAELEPRADAVILHVYGEADAYTQPRWRRILDTALAEVGPHGRLVVDLSGIQFLGCRPILDLAERAQQGAARGVQILVFNPLPGVVDRVVDIAGLSAWLPVHATLAEALAICHSSAVTPARTVVPVPGAR
ncbi:anti-sigma factor antagonist [Nocardia asteroides]|uniref:anti-sigma factor antagonist n=1 Tax=Nocardia asteroides TaxID=1824 RepID=UPI003798F9ED